VKTVETASQNIQLAVPAVERLAYLPLRESRMNAARLS
jgi:hypothetical protein